MARRSPMNNRYQKGTTPKGAARKSAASAKPKRSTGEAAKSRADYRKKNKKKNSFLREMPTSAEYKHQRKTWWNCLGASFILLILSLLLTSTPQVYSAIRLSTEQAQQVGLAMTAMAMVFVVTAWYVDIKKIRPLVRAFEAEKAAGKKDKKESKEAKETKGTEDKKVADKKSDDKVKDDKKSDKKPKADEKFEDKPKDDKRAADSKKPTDKKPKGDKKSDGDKAEDEVKSDKKAAGGKKPADKKAADKKPKADKPKDEKKPAGKKTNKGKKSSDSKKSDSKKADKDKEDN